jgi:hypothetical protein
MATDPANLPKPDKILVETVCDLFLDHSEKHHSPDTFANYKHFLQSFSDSHGRQPAIGMKPFHVTPGSTPIPSGRVPGGTPSSP